MYILLKISLKFLFLYSDPVRPLHMHVLLNGSAKNRLLNKRYKSCLLVEKCKKTKKQKSVKS